MNSDSSYMEEAEDNTLPPEGPLPSSPPPNIPGPHGSEKSPSVASSTQRVIPSLSNDPFAQGEDAETYFTRPNRYFGPATTWRTWTEEERTLALGLDRVRSQDLSIHLFNAFALKRKARESQRGRRPKRSRKGKERASSVFSTTGENEPFEKPDPEARFSLPKSWTAWPMPPDQVPREELLPRVGKGGDFRAKLDTRPSSNLEEWVVATAMRLSRERWNARRWDTGTIRFAHEERYEFPARRVWD